MKVDTDRLKHSRYAVQHLLIKKGLDTEYRVPKIHEDAKFLMIMIEDLQWLSNL